ncbi:MAG: hypothetical protein ACYC64_09045 [Armatimonadota bacterium]
MKNVCYDAHKLLFRFVLIVLMLCVATAAMAVEQPRVLFDQYHSNQLSMSGAELWSLSMLAGELANNGYAVAGLEVPVSAFELQACDVFVITAPAANYSSSEKTALQAFASAGGGVWMAADYGWFIDHPTAWASACQGIANALGYNLDNNRVTDADHDLYDYLYWIGLDSSTLGNHEVVRGVGSLICYSTTSLTGPSGASALVSTYSASNPPNAPLAMAGSYSSGRVVVTGSSLYMANPAPRNINGQLVTMEGITGADNRRFTYQAITYLAGAKSRPLVSISAPNSNQLVYGTVEVTGTACDSGLTSYVVDYAPVSDPSAFTPIFSGSNCRVVQTLTQWNTSIVPEGDYLIRVTATNAAGNSYSRTTNVTVKHLAQAQTIQEAKALPDDTLVRLQNKAAVSGSADFNGCFYAAEQSRLGGIRIKTTAAVNAGDTVSVLGLMATADGERYIECIELE